MDGEGARDKVDKGGEDRECCGGVMIRAGVGSDAGICEDEV